jgi:hypothetical protein
VLSHGAMRFVLEFDVFVLIDCGLDLDFDWSLLARM